MLPRAPPGLPASTCPPHLGTPCNRSFGAGAGRCPAASGAGTLAAAVFFIQFNSLLPCLQLPLYTRTVRDPDSNCFEDRYRRPRWGRGRGGESSTCSTRNRRCGRVCVRHSWRSCWAQAECAMTPRCRPRPELRSHHAAPHRAACHPVLVHCWDMTGIAAGKSASGAAASLGAGPCGR